MFKGRPFLGAFSGFFLGLFLGPTLWLWGVIPFHSPLLWVLPLIGIVLGMAMAAWAPFGSGAPAEPTATADTIGYAAAGDAERAPSGGTTLEQDVVEAPEPGDDGT